MLSQISLHALWMSVTSKAAHLDYPTRDQHGNIGNAHSCIISVNDTRVPVSRLAWVDGLAHIVGGRAGALLVANRPDGHHKYVNLGMSDCRCSDVEDGVELYWFERYPILTLFDHRKDLDSIRVAAGIGEEEVHLLEVHRDGQELKWVLIKEYTKDEVVEWSARDMDQMLKWLQNQGKSALPSEEPPQSPSYQAQMRRVRKRIL